jgi:hypothetical protein
MISFASLNDYFGCWMTLAAADGILALEEGKGSLESVLAINTLILFKFSLYLWES